MLLIPKLINKNWQRNFQATLRVKYFVVNMGNAIEKLKIDASVNM